MNSINKGTFRKSSNKTDAIKEKILQRIMNMADSKNYQIDDMSFVSAIIDLTITEIQEIYDNTVKAWDLDHDQLVVKLQEKDKEIKRLKSDLKEFENDCKGCTEITKSTIEGLQKQNQELKNLLEKDSLKLRIRKRIKELKSFPAYKKCPNKVLFNYDDIIKELNSLVEGEK